MCAILISKAFCRHSICLHSTKNRTVLYRPGCHPHVSTLWSEQSSRGVLTTLLAKADFSDILHCRQLSFNCVSTSSSLVTAAGSARSHSCPVSRYATLIIHYSTHSTNTWDTYAWVHVDSRITRSAVLSFSRQAAELLWSLLRNIRVHSIKLGTSTVSCSQGLLFCTLSLIRRSEILFQLLCVRTSNRK